MASKPDTSIWIKTVMTAKVWKIDVVFWVIKVLGVHVDYFSGGTGDWRTM